ncbi:acylase, partial [Bacteroidota bacterium]
TWGIPHIEAKNDKELFYAFGWAQMHLHGNLILELYGKSRGQAAEYWGERYLQEDIMSHTIGFPEMAEEWYQKLDPVYRSYMDAFTQGLNDYAETHSNSFKKDLAIVLPIQKSDIIKHYVYVIYGQFVAGSDIYQSVRWSQRGSNTYAVSANRSTSGNAMLVQNPHLPWSGLFTWIEAQFKSPETNMYGATLVGLPVLGIAFNEYLGWSHTNNTIDPTDVFELTLKEDGYQFDNEIKPFNTEKKVLKVKTNAGIEDREIEIRESIHGPVVAIKDNKALALRLPITDRFNGLDQWWSMGKAKNFEEFEAALKKHQIPFFNIMYADREGNIFYMFNGFVPRRPEGDFSFWRGTVPGNSSRYFWDDILSFEELPKIKNPETGWLQNANDPPWTCTVPVELNHKDYPSYLAPVRMGLRPQRSARMLYEDDQITFDELVEYKLSTRIELADRLLDDLFIGVEQYGTDISKQAMSILEKWDRSTNVESRGAVLFNVWAGKFNFWDQRNYEIAWDLNDPINTPDGIKNPEAAVQALDEAANEILDQYEQLDVAWGEVYRLKRGGINLPSNGSTGGPGVFRVVGYSQDEDGKYYATSGDSWVGIIEFGEKVKAKVLLSYGNSSNPDSPHFGDQLELFSNKSFRDAWIYREDLSGNIKNEEVLSIPEGL